MRHWKFFDPIGFCLLIENAKMRKFEKNGQTVN